MAEVKKSADKLTAAVENIDPVIEPRVLIKLPRLEESHDGMRVDQYEHVTVNGETTLIRRGEAVEVTVPVYLQLKNKFPDI